MADSGITHDDMIAGLRGLRLPETAAGGLVADIAVAAALGLVLACIISALLPLISRRRVSARQAPDLAEQVRALRAGAEDDRILGLLRLIRVHDPAAADDLRRRLYRAGDFPDAAELEARLLALGDAHA